MQAHLENTVPFQFSETKSGIDRIELAYGVAGPAGRPALAIELAWQMRQRDCTLALQLVGDSWSDLHNGADPEVRDGLLARSALIRGEVDWLFARLDASQQQANNAMQAFTELQDAAGIADCHWLMAMLAVDRGDRTTRDTHLRQMAATVANSDLDRLGMAQGALAFNATFADPVAAMAEWGPLLLNRASHAHPAIACWIEDFQGQHANLTSNFALAVRHFSEVYNQALLSGQMRRAVIGATNTAAALVNLSDFHTALEWTERGLRLARGLGWPGSIAITLQQTAATLRQLKRLDAARAMLQEALELMEPLAASRNFAITLWFLGEVELDSKDFRSALTTYTTMADRADALQQPDLQAYARCGQARAYLELGFPAQALEAAHTAQTMSQDSVGHQVEVLKILADIHASSELPAPPDMQAASAPLHFLQQALDLSATIEGLTIPGELLDAVAREYARAGDFSNAYAFSRQSMVATEKTSHLEAENRAIAMQINHEMERTRAEVEHQKRLAIANAERLETLERLGAIGRDITRNLEPAAILQALDRHVHALLDATSFIIYRLDPGGSVLRMRYGVESGRQLARHEIDLNVSDGNAARCARERHEIVLQTPPGRGPVIAGTLETVSLMFAPLMIADQLLGVMTIQSVQANAYADREIAIFRTLSAYGAIALANADAQALLIEQNHKLAALSDSDHLTGLCNRLRLERVLEEELARSFRSNAPLAVILIDVDHFKAVNDEYGHQVGDQVLVTISRLLESVSREIDVVGRWGGEEFLVVCRETDLAGATILADKLRNQVGDHPFTVIGRKTASFGVAGLRSGESIDSLIGRADAALYRAKKSGRNAVVVD